MSTTLERPDSETRTPKRTLPGPDGLVWTVLRLHRTALWMWVGYVVISVGLLLWLWGPGSSAAREAFDAFGYTGAQDNAFHGLSSTLPLFGSFDAVFYNPLSLTRIASVAVALFAAGPLIARELESGTAQLAWTQSVTPARWLATKLIVPALFVAVGTSLVVVLYRMVWDARGHLLVAGIGPRDFAFSIGLATVADVLFGLALGVLVALLVRRTLPALAIAGIGQYFAGALRGNSWPFQGWHQQPELPIHSKAITTGGAEVSDPRCYLEQKCLDEHHIAGFTREYLPSPDYWPRQLTETGILLGLTVLAVVAAFLVLRRYQPKRPKPVTQGAAA
ncbi:hypothetical protein OKJ48_07165 [Streptomyces kunmingensis]|uniref:ABC transporter permease n=1 Tax=Streptomyces kunmingensis TaxID=68225 RepID=A0ABU6C7F5_9ACTN|nr:hypothetical protein [Streptomyces kunmingensis]MEB3960031.1 hypothetical protein [Streptomyces kunmingensis]